MKRQIDILREHARLTAIAHHYQRDDKNKEKALCFRAFVHALEYVLVENEKPHGLEYEGCKNNLRLDGKFEIGDNNAR